MSSTDWLDNLVVDILSPYEYVAMAAMGAKNGTPPPIRSKAYDAYMKRHGATRSAIIKAIEARLPEERKPLSPTDFNDDSAIRFLDNMKSTGWNECLKAVKEALEES